MCNKIALIVGLIVKVTHNGPDEIVLFQTGTALDMSKSSKQNALSEMNDN